MQTANIVLALGGDRNNTVPKYNVTPAEAAVMRQIHGDDSVREVNITGSVQRTHRQEIGRLAERYGRRDGERRISPEVNELFPGAAARVFETFDELELPEDFYVAQGRKTTAAPRKANTTVENMTVKELQVHADKIGCDLAGVSKKADIIEAIKLHESAAAPAAPAPAPEPEEADEVGTIDDEFSDTVFE